MKMLEIDWRDFIHAAELYQRLPVGARAFFVETVMPKQAVTNALMGEWREALLHSGLMVSGVQGKNASVDPRRGHFNRVMRSLRRYPILESPSRETFRDFVVEHLEDAELRALSEKKQLLSQLRRNDRIVFPRLFRGVGEGVSGGERS